MPKIISKWTKVINIRVKAMKLLKENIGVKSLGLRNGFGNGFLDMIPKA